MIDLRYHVYSLAAVFFALAIGIVIGTSFVAKPADVTHMKNISDKYERNMTTVRQEMDKQQAVLRNTRDELTKNDKALTAVVPIAIKSRLLYHNVAIVQTGDYDDLTARLRVLVESAGANVTSVTKISTTFDFENADAMAEIATATEIWPEQGENTRTAVLHAVADAISLSRRSDRLPTLEEKRMLTLTGDYNRRNTIVLLVGGASAEETRRCELVEGPIIDGLTTRNTRVVACEPFSVGASCITHWKRMNIATVDNADRPAGQIALVCALTGEKANFGQKPTANRFVPETLRQDR